ncbi:uncharacterized protein LOC130046375 isoform X2 [Ostrea edulis]|uniref:uncharacterized protein LOC130046375 isoform X2 n=1 Tax=Ostrea edulis TaxID=37623 RepID=UPI0024AF9825|nr:uncharacterized protein LOC130046375 isoform X2 [Ostrea edulis]
MDLVISHPAIVDKGIRNIYSGLHSHHIVGSRSCDTGVKLYKEDFNHVHAMEKFRRSQLEYIPKFKTCLPKAPAYTTVNNRKVKKIVERLYSAGRRPQTCVPQNAEPPYVRPGSFSRSQTPTPNEHKKHVLSAHPRALIIFPSAHVRKKESRGCVKTAKTTSSVSDEKTLKSECSTSCKSELNLDLSKLKTRKKRRFKSSPKSEGHPTALSEISMISNCYSEKGQTHYKPSRHSLFEMIQDLYLDEDID